MKRFIVSFVMLVIGFIGGIYAFLRWIAKLDNTLNKFKEGLVDDFERLLLGYNTVKTRRRFDYYSYYHGPKKRRYFGDYYHSNDFNKDEEEE